VRQKIINRETVNARCFLRYDEVHLFYPLLYPRVQLNAFYLKQLGQYRHELLGFYDNNPVLVRDELREEVRA
jgi:hypothetical protein